MSLPDSRLSVIRRIPGLRLAVGVAVAAALAALSVVVVGSAGADPGQSASTRFPGPNGSIELSVRPNENISPTGAEISVRGSGFDPSGELWIAICQDDGVAPASFAHCLGGAIPNANSTSAWGVVTPDGQAPYAGPVSAQWQRRGSFKITLQVPVAAGQDADCIAGRCSVYTRSSDDQDRGFDARIPIRFSPPRQQPTPTSTPPTTEVIGTAVTTVAPDSVLQTSVAAGAEQTVEFSGFTPGEAVDVMLYSDPIVLPTVQADGAGGVRVAFTVPADLPPGEHLIQAIGRQSGRVGVAQFTVGDPVGGTTGISATADTATTTGTAIADAGAIPAAPLSTVPSASAEPTPTPESVAPPASSAAAPAIATTAETTAEVTAGTAADAVASAAGTASGAARLLWLWVVLVAIVVIGGAAAAVVLLRRRREYDDAPPQRPVDEVIPAPGWHEMHSPAQDPDWPLNRAAEPAGNAPQSRVDEAFGLISYGAAASPLVPNGAAISPDGGGPATEQWQPLFDERAVPESAVGSAPGASAPGASAPDSGSPVPGGSGPRPDFGRHRSE